MPTTPQKGKSDSQNTRRDDQSSKQMGRSDDQNKKLGSQDQSQDRKPPMGTPSDRDRSGSDRH
ncbi:hypothetical protein [Lysobacter sp. P5_B9]